MSALRKFFHREDGASAAEFALVLPVFLLFTFGLIEFGMLFYTSTQLHWATEDAARCSSVRPDCKTTNATNNALVVTWARNHYRGLSVANFASFTNGTCNSNGATNTGHVVTGSTTFVVNLGVFYKPVPINSRACFP